MLTNPRPPQPASPEYWKTKQWLLRHDSELVQEYPDEWIAAWGDRVLSSGTDLTGVRDRARRNVGGDDFILWFVEATPRVYAYRADVEITPGS
jgi:hypothetical protein